MSFFPLSKAIPPLAAAEPKLTGLLAEAPLTLPTATPSVSCRTKLIARLAVKFLIGVAFFVIERMLDVVSANVNELEPLAMPLASGGFTPADKVATVWLASV